MSNKNKQRVTLFLNPKIAKQAKAQAIVDDLSLSTLVKKALIEYLPKETVIKKAEVRMDADSYTEVASRKKNR